MRPFEATSFDSGTRAARKPTACPPPKRKEGASSTLAGVVTLLALSLGACSAAATQPGGSLGAARQQMLESSLRVSAAAMQSGQSVAAGRMYRNLSAAFPEAPEPKLGLAYMALQADEYASAETLFSEAGDLATQPALKAEALLGAARASLGQRDLAQAKTRFLSADELAQDTPLAAWVANGLAVVATLEGDYPLAEQYYREALDRNGASDTRRLIAANLVRMLVAAGRSDDARRVHDGYTPAYWADGDSTALSHLLQDSQDGKRNDRGAEHDHAS